MPRALLPLFFFALISCLLAIGLAAPEKMDWPAVKQMIRDEFPEIEHVSVAVLSDRLAGESAPLLLDVRGEEEFRVSHLAGAVRVDPGDLDPVLPAGVGKDTWIVAYCSVGYRSSALVRRLSALGYRRVANLEGSIFEWANRGYPVVRDGVEVRAVHPFNKRWGRLLHRELRAYSAD